MQDFTDIVKKRIKLVSASINEMMYSLVRTAILSCLNKIELIQNIVSERERAIRGLIESHGNKIQRDFSYKK